MGVTRIPRNVAGSAPATAAPVAVRKMPAVGLAVGLAKPPVLKVQQAQGEEPMVTAAPQPAKASTAKEAKKDEPATPRSPSSSGTPSSSELSSSSDESAEKVSPNVSRWLCYADRCLAEACQDSDGSDAHSARD
jgi:hypothetical protein